MTIRLGLENWTEPDERGLADLVDTLKTIQRERNLETVFAGLLWSSISFGSIAVAIFLA
jgi:hypothetical protein